MYGMNFKNMPELDWAWGYPYGSRDDRAERGTALLWFKWRAGFEMRRWPA